MGVSGRWRDAFLESGGALAAIVWLSVLVCGVCASPTPSFSQPIPAGLASATLSFIDAAAGRLEAVRHWPQAPVGVDIYPFVPYFWTGCPGPGAIMILVTGPGIRRNLIADHAGDVRASEISTRLEETVRTALHEDATKAAELQQLVLGTRTPGDALFEAAKALAPLITDLGTYERRGYAVFAFITWQGWRCNVIFRAVPEGYGIPFVR